MNKKEKYLVGIVGVVVLVIVGIVLTWTFLDDGGSASDSDKEITVVITANDEEVARETIGISSEDTLMEVMEAHFEMGLADDGFIESIEGIEQNPSENLFWVFEANDEMVTVSAEEFVPEDQDVVTWELMAF